MTNQFDRLFYAAGQRYAGGTGLDPASFAALIKAHGIVESGLDPTAYRLFVQGLNEDAEARGQEPTS